MIYLNMELMLLLTTPAIGSPVMKGPELPVPVALLSLAAFVTVIYFTVSAYRRIMGHYDERPGKFLFRMKKR
jgi:hypothetical protein